MQSKNKSEKKFEYIIMIGITNASPLIYLGKIGALDILSKIFSDLYTTEIVMKEVTQKENAPEIQNNYHK